MSYTFGSVKDPSESLVYGFDFTAILGVAEVITGCVVTCLPTGCTIVGGADLTLAPVVRQRVSGGVHGAVYQLVATATTNAGNTLVLSGTLRVLNGGD